MKPLLNALLAVFLVVAPSTNGFAETVAEFLLRSVDARNFSDPMLHPEAKSIAIGQGTETVFSRTEMVDYLTRFAAVTKQVDVSSFEIQQETVVGDFVSVVYSFAYRIDAGDTTVAGTLRSLEILQKRGSSYRFVFGVQIEPADPDKPENQPVQLDHTVTPSE